MRDILALRHRDVLEQFAWSNVMLAFDYDGTLAPIVDDPHRASMRATTRELLQTLAGLYPCAVVSGRSRADVLARVRGLGIDEVVGNHGAEPASGETPYEKTVRVWHATMEESLRDLRGVWIEDKRGSLTIHYRASRQKKKARTAILGAAARLKGARILGGKQVISIVPESAPHKGIGIERAMQRLKCDTAVYVGDDETDEDVFTFHEPERLLTIRVGRSRASKASYYIRSQREVDALLRALIAPRRRRVPRRARR